MNELMRLKNVSNKLHKNQCQPENFAFIWKYCIKYFYTDNEIFFEFGNFRQKYGYDYQGLSKSIIVTKLTNRIILSVFHAKCIGMGCSLEGPAGTGKTETIKYIANLLGLPVYIFNCSESFDVKVFFISALP